MDITTLKRDKGRVHNALKILADGSVIALEPLVVHLPTRYIEKGLAEVTDLVDTIGAIGMVVGNYYCCFIAQTIITLLPGNIREISIDGNKYHSLEFEKGDTVIQNLTTPIVDKTNSRFFKEFATYGKLPWFMDKDNLSKLFDHSHYVTGKSVGVSPQVFRVLVGLMLRDPDNPEKPYRYSEAIRKNIPPLIVGLNNHSMLITGTFNRLNGGYLADNTISAILNPETRITDTEMVMRGIPYESAVKE